MNKRAISNTEHQQKYATAIRQANLAGQSAFQAWFNKSQDAEQSIVRGYWDFTTHILTKKVCEYLTRPEEQRALEIGYGGGRVLNAACSYFKEVIGIDIHNEQATVETFLKEQGKNNFRLIRTAGNSLNVESESVNFIYSFIVLQHLPSFDVLSQYIQETSRCLTPDGVAQLYFGKYAKLNLTNYLRYFIQGYKEIPEAPVNHISLVVRVSKMKKLCQNNCLKVVDAGTSYKNSPDGYSRIKGSQNYLTLLKNKIT